MFSFKRTFINTSDAKELQYYLNNKKGNYKEITKEIVENIEAFYIIGNDKSFNDYPDLKHDAEADNILLLNYAEYEELTSKKQLKQIIGTKTVIDLRRS